MGVIGLTVLIWLYLRHRRRRQPRASAQVFDNPELDGSGRGDGYVLTYSRAQEADGRAIRPVEKEAKERAFEMPAT